MRHNHRYWFVSRHISSFTMQRMHLCNAQWESTASTEVIEILLLWILCNSYMIPITHFGPRYLISFDFSIDMQQSIVNATNYTVAKSFMIILEHRKLLDIHHHCVRTVLQSISYTIELFWSTNTHDTCEQLDVFLITFLHWWCNVINNKKYSNEQSNISYLLYIHNISSLEERVWIQTFCNKSLFQFITISSNSRQSISNKIIVALNIFVQH